MFSYSKNEESYIGEFETIEEACQEAASEFRIGTIFWVGEDIPPTQPENLWRASDWLEQVSSY